MASKDSSKKDNSKKDSSKKDSKEDLVTKIAIITFVFALIVMIVVSTVPGKAGPMGAKGMPGDAGVTGYGNTEMGPTGDMGMTGATGQQGMVEYNRWIAVELGGKSTTIPYQGITKYVNYYWEDPNPNPDYDMYVYIDATQLKPGDIFTITNFTENSYLYIKPNGFQNGNDQNTNYYLRNGKNIVSSSTVSTGYPNTALIIVTRGATNTSTPDPDAKLINITYSTIQTFNISLVTNPMP